MTFTVFGNYGEMTVDAATGEVLVYHVEDDAYLPGDPEAPGYRDILCFDLQEWREAYPEETIDGSHVDVVDIGFWTNSGEYIEAEHDHRHLIRTGEFI